MRQQLSSSLPIQSATVPERSVTTFGPNRLPAAGLYWTDRIILRARGPRQFAVMKICSVSALLRRGAFVTHVFDPLTALLTLATQCLGLTQIKVSTCGNNKFALAEAEKWKSSLIKFPI
jgi:hypothetical protein